jgi:hypothetical protein
MAVSTCDVKMHGARNDRTIGRSCGKAEGMMVLP